MANITNPKIKFGVVYGAPSQLSAEKIEEGKLYFLAGDESNGIKQGIYGVNPLTSDVPNGVFDLALFGTGAIANGSGYGLSQDNFTKDASIILKALNDASNSYLLESNYVEVNATTNGYVPMCDASDGTIDSSTKDWVLTYDSSSQKLGWYKLPKNAFLNDKGVTSVTITQGEGITCSSSGTAITSTGTRTISLKKATNSSLGGIKLGYTDNGKNYKVQVDDSGNAYVNVPWVDKPADSSHADSADKVSNTFDISVGGAKKITYNGSINKTLAFTGLNNIAVSGDEANNVLTISIDGSAFVTKETFNSIVASLEGALTYEGAVSKASDLPSNLTSNDKGKVYIASTEFYYPNDTDKTYKIESQDMFIWDGAKWNIIDGQGAVENLSATLSYGGTSNIATVDGVNISLTMPDASHYESKNIVANASTDKSNEAVTTNGVYLNHIENAAVTSSHKIIGSGIVKVTSSSDGVITITGTEVGDVSAVVAGSGLTGGGNSGSVTLNVNGHQGIIVSDNSVGANLKETSSLGTIGTTSKLYGVGLDSSGYLAVAVPWDDNTDTKVTSEDNHYLPQANDSSKLTKTASSSTAATWSSTDMITGITLMRDTRGHVTDVSISSIQLPGNPNTWRNIYVNGSQKISTATNSGALKFVDSSYIKAVWDATNKTIQFDASGLATTNDVEAATIYWETL